MDKVQLFNENEIDIHVVSVWMELSTKWGIRNYEIMNLYLLQDTVSKFKKLHDLLNNYIALPKITIIQYMYTVIYNYDYFDRHHALYISLEN